MSKSLAALGRFTGGTSAAPAVYNPANDRAQSFALMSPEDQNWEFAHADNGGAADLSPMAPWWKQYYNVLNARGAQLNPVAHGNADSHVGDSPQWWLQGMTGASNAPTPGAEANNEPMMPASLRGLYRAQFAGRG